MPNGYARIAYEDTPGNETNTPTLSTKKLFPPIQSLSPKPGTSHLMRDDEVRNTDEPLAVIPEAYAPSWDMSSRAYPDTLAFTLGLALGAPSTTAGDGAITDLAGTAVPTGAYRHRWTAPFGPTGPSPRSAQFDVAYSDQSVYYKLKGAGVSELGISSPEEGGVQLSASGPCLYMDRQNDPSLTPSYESLSIRPFTRGNLTLPSNLSGTGTTEDFTVSISNPIDVVRSLGIASRWPDVLEKDAEGPIVVSGEISKRQLDADDVDALKNATGFALRAQWSSDTNIGATSYPYKFTVKCDNAQYTDGDPDGLQNRRRHGHSFMWKSTTTSTGSTTVEVVNATSSYS
jgi:hypothetical protein